MATPNRPLSQAKYSTQNMGNTSFDEDFGVNTVETLGFDGQNLQRLNGNALNYKIVTVGNDKYIGIAAPGTAQTTAKWQARKISDDGAGTITITWASGGSFNQQVDNITGLTYS